MRNPVAVLLLILVVSWCPAAAGAEPPTTVILVRHAEKRSEGSDPGLTSEGLARARALARTLESVELHAVFSTQFRRTGDTARAVADRRGLEVSVDPAGGQDLASYARAFVRKLLDLHAGETVLVVGHSNTVPAFIEALGVKSAPAIGEQVYDDLFVVTVSPDGEPRLLHLHYGEPSRDATTDD